MSGIVHSSRHTPSWRVHRIGWPLPSPTPLKTPHFHCCRGLHHTVDHIRPKFLYYQTVRFNTSYDVTNVHYCKSLDVARSAYSLRVQCYPRYTFMLPAETFAIIKLVMKKKKRKSSLGRTPKKFRKFELSASGDIRDYITLHYITLHYITLHYITKPFCKTVLQISSS